MSEHARQLTIDISDKQQADWLKARDYNLQIAKSVICNGKLMFNTVWKSKNLAPYITAKWTPVYGFNWTSDVPASGVQISTGGKWQRCDLGQVLDIDDVGFFTVSAIASDSSAMKIGKNNYVGDSDDGIRMVIGVQNTLGEFEPIFVDPVSIGVNMSATFQPQEQVQWWFDSGSKEATIISDHKTPVEAGDYSKPSGDFNNFKKISQYSHTTGTWTTKGQA